MNVATAPTSGAVANFCLSLRSVCHIVGGVEVAAPYDENDKSQVMYLFCKQLIDFCVVL